MKIKMNHILFSLFSLITWAQSLFHTNCYRKIAYHLSSFKEPSFSGKYLDVQWNIHRQHFEGKWNGSVNWYNEKNNYSLPYLKTHNNYEIEFFDDNTGVYKKNNGKTMIISRNNYNNMGTAFMFPSDYNYGGAGGQCSRIINYYLSNNDYFTNEINFLYEKMRSIIIFNYKYNNNKIRLQSIGISNLNYPDEYPVKLFQIDDINLFLYLINDWKGYYSSFNPFIPLSSKYKRISKIDLSQFLMTSNRICRIYPNNVIISIPKIIDDYKEFFICVGCLQSPFSYKQVIINYDLDGVLTSWDYIELKPF